MEERLFGDLRLLPTLDNEDEGFASLSELQLYI
jgi:hypothetical protein